MAEHSTAASRSQHYQTTLARSLEPLLAEWPQLLAGAPIAISGMASSSIGWQELPYARLPMSLDGSGLLWRDAEPLSLGDTEHRVILVSGARTDTDVLRGEETEVIGLFNLGELEQFQARSLVIKPGTHSKHVQVADGQLVDFATFMTGELFDVLSRHSILRYSIEPADAQEQLTLDPDDLRRRACCPFDAASCRTVSRTYTPIDRPPGRLPQSDLPQRTAVGERTRLSGRLLDD